MTALELKYVQRFVDRHGTVRHYFRKPGHVRLTLPGEVGSAEFMTAYQVALETLKNRTPAPKAGTISALVTAYYQSGDWADLRDSTKKGYRNVLERFRNEYGNQPAALLQRKHAQAIRDKGADRPGATRDLLKRLRSLYNFGLERGLVQSNPFEKMRMPKAGPGFRPWTEDHIEQFLEKWPAGTRAHLALHLLLYTGQRRSDVVRMGRQHVRANMIRVAQLKTDALLDIPIHPTLKAVLDDLPKDNLTFLMTEYGDSMSAAGFTNWFVECARAAGLPEGLTPHGLRKAACRRLAEAGCTAHQIAAVSGHTTLSEVEIYTKSANQRLMAEAAMGKLKDGT